MDLDKMVGGSVLDKLTKVQHGNIKWIKAYPDTHFIQGYVPWGLPMAVPIILTGQDDGAPVRMISS